MSDYTSTIKSLFNNGKSNRPSNITNHSDHGVYT